MRCYDRRVIVDFHTHIFPPEVGSNRDAHVRDDTTFAELYGSPAARLATADDLLASMDEAGIDVSVALGFAWRGAAACRAHNDYLLDAARRSNGRIIAFCSLPLADGAEAIEAEGRRCLAEGARGFGELRPDNLGCDLAGEAGEGLGRLAAGSGAVLLFHASEPVGHAYPGKLGLDLAGLYGFILRHPQARIVAAHWGGGLPFYALMPEVRAALANVSFDTAASSLLYGPEVFAAIPSLTGAASVLFGSDYPLLGQKRSRHRIEEARLDATDRELILGGNAARLLGLE
jgi:predicted TIM-barrel fold metal-dependent hydrolase